MRGKFLQGDNVLWPGRNCDKCDLFAATKLLVKIVINTSGLLFTARRYA